MNFFYLDVIRHKVFPAGNYILISRGFWHFEASSEVVSWEWFKNSSTSSIWSWGL